VAEPDDSKLLSVAESISEGAIVDWDRIDPAASEPDSEILRELRVLDRIATFHRHPEPYLATDPSDDPIPQEAVSEPVAVKRSWGNLTIVEEIGEGSFAKVYKAIDRGLQTEVALKLLKTGARGQRTDDARVVEEARLLARVRHANVVTVHGADRIDGQVGLWMELVKGRTLSSLLNTHGPLSPREAALIGLDLCRALAAVHAAGLLHGDVKARNIMREDGGRTVLMDFGTGADLARDPRPVEVSSDDFAGTPLYLPPEIFAGERRTKATDLYSLGVLLYHLVTASYPVDGKTRADVERAHRRRELKRLRDVRPDLPEEFVQIVERALAADPEDRYRTAGAFEAALARFLGRPAPAAQWFEERGRLAAILVSIAVLVIAIGSTYWITSRDARTGGETTTVAKVAIPPAAPPSAPSTYQIQTSFYQHTAGEAEFRLKPGERVAPGNTLFAKVSASVPLHIYIVNEDERGNSILLFPLPGQTLTNPVPPGKEHRLPGLLGSQEYFWVVDTAGGREHFLVFASPEPPAFAQSLAALRAPEIGKPIELPRALVGALRSVGGLAPAPEASKGIGPLSLQYQTPLVDGVETTKGLTVRQFTLENPRR
jgi:serine/threonine protein kinase